MKKLLGLTLPHPLFSLMGFYATLRSFSLAQKHFPKTHSNNGIGNAFRHSLWNCLILMYCCKISSPQKALDYCKKMTDLHEELFPNEPLETKMDLHNNQLGINLFVELLPGIHRQFFETSFFVEKLIQKTKTAKILEKLEDDFGDEMVYLKD
jgi:predicted metal-binding transcription factor (methanogenesis marker protein 9)